MYGMNVIHEYLPLLDPIWSRLGAKMYQIWILTVKVAQGQSSRAAEFAIYGFLLVPNSN